MSGSASREQSLKTAHQQAYLLTTQNIMRSMVVAILGAICAAYSCTAQLASREQSSLAVFLDWLAFHGVNHSTVTLRLTASSGVGIFAATSISADSPIVQIPPSIIVDYKTVIGHPVIGPLVTNLYAHAEAGQMRPHLLELLKPDLVSRAQSLAAFLHYEYFYARASSPWRPWLDALPLPEECGAMPLFWATDAVALAASAELGSSPAATQHLTGSQWTTALVELHRSALWARLPRVYGDASQPLVLARLTAELFWAHTMVQSRAFGGVRGRHTALVPLADMANHDLGAPALLTVFLVDEAHRVSANGGVRDAGAAAAEPGASVADAAAREILSPAGGVARGAEIRLQYFKGEATRGRYQPVSVPALTPRINCLTHPHSHLPRRSQTAPRPAPAAALFTTASSARSRPATASCLTRGCCRRPTRMCRRVTRPRGLIDAPSYSDVHQAPRTTAASTRSCLASLPSSERAALPQQWVEGTTLQAAPRLIPWTDGCCVGCVGAARNSLRHSWRGSPAACCHCRFLPRLP